MVRINLRKLVGALASFFILSSSIGISSALADTESSTMNVVVDTKDKYGATGSMSVIDNTNGTGFDGPESPIVINKGNGECTSLECWAFSLKYKGASWGLAGLTEGQIGIRGAHYRPRHGEGVNNLTADGLGYPNFGTFYFSRAKNFNFHDDLGESNPGDAESLTVSKTKNHGTDVDKWSVDSNPSVTDGAGNQLGGGTTKVKADHIKKKATCDPDKKTAGATNSSSTYDHTTGTLTITAGVIDVLDSVGGSSGTIEAAYVGDAILSAVVSVDQISVVSNVTGRFEFTGGEVNFTDPSTQYSLTGTFDRFYIGDTSAASIDSYGLFSETLITDTAEPANGPSDFLTDFVDTNLFADGMTDYEFAQIAGVGLRIVTPINLATVTNDFTTSIAGFPTAIYVTACEGVAVVPALSRGWMVGLAVLMSLSVAITLRRFGTGATA